VTDTRVLVLGAGSSGARHARHLAAAGATVSITDPDSSRASAVHDAVALPYDLEVIDDYPAVVVASPSALHVEQAERALVAGAHVLVEKPLALTAAGAERLVAGGNGRLMVGYNLRLHEPVMRFMDLVHGGRAGTMRSARLWFGSYLPDWRPWVDYRTTYSARRELGGGVLFDAIHELDLLVWLLGPDLDVVGAVVDRIGPLDINVEDTVKAVLRSPEGPVAEVSLDYLSRRYRRGIEVVGDDATLRLDWARHVMEIEDAGGIESHDALEDLADSYERQARSFLDWVAGRAEPPVDGPTGAASVRLADAIVAAAR
jgi:predicted dehydrogenase